MNNKWLPISLFTLALAVLFSGFQITHAIASLSTSPSSHPSSSDISNQIARLNSTLQALTSFPSNPSGHGITSLLTNPDSMYLGDAAKYLGISQEELTKIINDPESHLPFLKTSFDTYIFNKQALDKWLEKSYIIH